MESEDNLISFEMQPRPRIKLKTPPPKPTKRTKINRVKSPEDNSVKSLSVTSSLASNATYNAPNPNIFLTKSKPQSKRTTKFVSENEISNQSTIASLEELRNETASDIRSASASETEESSKTSSQSIKPMKSSLGSNTKLYREKLKKRFQSMKQKSSESTNKSSLQNFKRTSKDVANLNKCIDSLQNDNHNINLQMKAHQRYAYQGNSGEVSSAEKYQFFCESIAKDDIDLGENKKGDELEDDKSVVVYKQPENVREILNKSYEECTWSTKKSTSPIALGSNEELGFRNLEDEGIYTVKPPKLPERHLQQLKRRLLADENKDFINTAGDIKFDESNYSAVGYRPDHYDEDTPFDLIYHKATTTIPPNISSVTVSQHEPTLEININTLRFTNHALFSSEHLLQEKLISLFNLHRVYHVGKLRETLRKRLETLRNDKVKYVQRIETENASGDTGRTQSTDLKNILLETIKQIKKVREEYYEECKKSRHNVKNILEVWKNLKNLRINNGYSSTTIKLIINQHSESEAFWENPNDILIEIQEEEDCLYKEQLNEHKKKLKVWQHKIEDANNDDANLDKMIDDKPVKPPRSINLKKLKQNLVKILEEAFGNSVEPVITFAINYSHQISPSEDVKEEEKNRRSLTEATKFKLKLYLNNVFICKTKVCLLNHNFTIIFDEVLSLKLMKNESLEQDIEVKLFELKQKTKENSQYSFRRAWTLISSAKIKIPKMQQLISQSEFMDVHFSDNNKKTTGFLAVCIGWDTIRVTTSREKTDNLTEKNIQNWIKENNLDPEDPRNTIFSDYIEETQEEITSTTNEDTNSNIFRCDPFLDSFTISSIEEIENNVRFQLLQLRNNNEPEFVGMIVPSRLNEIPCNIFSTYKRRIEEERYAEYFTQEDSPNDDIVSKRSLGRKYLRQIQTKIFQICRNSGNNLCYEDVVDEKMVPWLQKYLKTCLSNFINWFKVQPEGSTPLPLLELRSEVNAINEQQIRDTYSFSQKNTTYNKKINVVINLKGGINIRIKYHNDADSNIKHYYFIEFATEKTTVRSKLCEGYQEKNVSDCLQCKWNEMIKLPLTSENLDYLNPNSLTETISIKLFESNSYLDDKKHEDDSDGKEMNATLLGYVLVPISAAISDKLEGEFPLRSPPFIYNYEKVEETRSAGTPRTPTFQNNKNNQKLTYLDMELQVDSIVPKMSSDLTSINCGEPPYIRDHIIEWNKRYNTDHPKRKFSVLAIDSNGQTICLTRYIRLLEPPKLNTDEFDLSLHQCARFVSLIPFNTGNKFYENVWLTAKQVLKLGVGSIYDHATLLTCYLLSLNLEVWLLIGQGIPYGNTAYVLLREYGDTPNQLANHFIIDVVTGVKYNVTDQYCPLKKVYCVADEYNIWANIQRGDAVFTTRFDFTRRFDWLALFNNTISAPTHSVQPNLQYVQTGNVHHLQNTIEKKLRKKIAKMREHDVTIWNHYVSNLLKSQIHKAEKNFMYSQTQLKTSSKILEYTNNYKISGCYQCLPFSSINNVVDEVLLTKIWNTTGLNEEFASCVQVNAYVNHVISIWVAFVSIVKR